MRMNFALIAHGSHEMEKTVVNTAKPEGGTSIVAKPSKVMCLATVSSPKTLKHCSLPQAFFALIKISLECLALMKYCFF